MNASQPHDSGQDANPYEHQVAEDARPPSLSRWTVLATGFGLGCVVGVTLTLLSTDISSLLRASARTRLEIEGPLIILCLGIPPSLGLLGGSWFYNNSSTDDQNASRGNS